MYLNLLTRKILGTEGIGVFKDLADNLHFYITIDVHYWEILLFYHGLIFSCHDSALES